MGRDSSVSIATRYELDGSGIESRWGRDFPHPSIPALGHIQPSIQWVSFCGVKRPGRGVDHPPTSSAAVKERVELHIYSSIWAFVACSRVTFTFTFTLIVTLLCDSGFNFILQNSRCKLLHCEWRLYRIYTGQWNGEKKLEGDFMPLLGKHQNRRV